MLASPRRWRSRLEQVGRCRAHASVALTSLPPGENGGLTFTQNRTDQAKLYDALTPLQGNITNVDLHRYFKPDLLGGDGAVRVENLGRVHILRDSFDVPHLIGKTQNDVEFGVGYATAEDRGLLLNLIRGPARAAAIDAPGINPIALARPARASRRAPDRGVPRPQVAALPAAYRRLLQSYVDGISAYFKKQALPVDPYATNDVVAAAALIAARFGANGGQLAEHASFLGKPKHLLGCRVELEHRPFVGDRDDAVESSARDGAALFTASAAACAP